MSEVPMVDDNEQAAERNQLIPLPSTLANQGPEFDGIIDQFVHNLPDMLAAIEAAYLAAEYTKVLALVHNLKGLGGGFGYPQLTELAMKIESSAADGNYSAIAQVISALQQLVRRIQAARPS